MGSNYKLNSFNKKRQGSREKLMQYGPDILSNAELLAIIFNTGTRSENVLELSSRCLKDYGHQAIKNIRKVEKAQELLNLSQVKACQIVALFEIGRRFFKEDTGIFPVIRSPKDVFKLYKNMGKLKREELRAIYLNSRQRLIHEELISIGGIDSVKVSIRNILQPAIELSIKSFIVLHNHPSGEIEVSEDDILFTRKLQKASKLVNLQLLDHIIISKDSYISMLS